MTASCISPVLWCILLLMPSSGINGNAPQVLSPGRSEHAITVGGATRHFVVKTQEEPTFAVLLLHGSTRHEGGDGLAPVRFFESEIKSQARLWADSGALLLFLAGRKVGSGHFCWGAGTHYIWRASLRTAVSFSTAR